MINALNNEVSRRYSRAFYETAQENGHVDVVLRDLSTLKKLIDEDPAQWRRITNPTVSSNTQKEVIDHLIENLHLCQLTHDFLSVVCANRRLVYLVMMIESFYDEHQRDLGVSQGVVEASEPLPQEALKDLEKSLKDKTGKVIELRQEVNEELLGGAVLRAGSWMVDASVSERLNKLRKVMKG